VQASALGMTLPIASAIESSTVVLLLASSAAFASPWVQREVEFAVQMSKPILPVQAEDCPWPNWALLLFGGIQQIALYQEAGNQQLASIVESIRHLAATGHGATLTKRGGGA
jgi:TIR domain